MAFPVREYIQFDDDPNDINNMNREELMSISGAPGLHRMLVPKPNGIVAENIETSERKFYSTRNHQFSPLDTIALYVEGNETTGLRQVLANMKAAIEDFPLPEVKSSDADFFEYLSEVLPNYDQDLVRARDVRKLVQWYGILDRKGLLDWYLEEESVKS